MQRDKFLISHLLAVWFLWSKVSLYWLRMETCCIESGRDTVRSTCNRMLGLICSLRVFTAVPWLSAVAAAAAAPGLCSGLSVLHSALSFMRSYSLILANALSKWITVLPGGAERKSMDRERQRNIVFKRCTTGFWPAQPQPSKASMIVVSNPSNVFLAWCIQLCLLTQVITSKGFKVGRGGQQAFVVHRVSICYPLQYRVGFNGYNLLRCILESQANIRIQNYQILP